MTARTPEQALVVGLFPTLDPAARRSFKAALLHLGYGIADMESSQLLVVDLADDERFTEHLGKLAQHFEVVSLGRAEYQGQWLDRYQLHGWGGCRVIAAVADPVLRAAGIR